MRRVERIANLHGVLQRLIERQGAFKRSPFDILHDQIVWADIVNKADVGMVERGNSLRLALEAFAELSGGDFDRYVALQAWIVRAIHLSHAAFANGRQNFIRPEFVAYSKRHLNESTKSNPLGSGWRLDDGPLDKCPICRDKNPRAQMAQRFTAVFKPLGFKYMTLDRLTTWRQLRWNMLAIREGNIDAFAVGRRAHSMPPKISPGPTAVLQRAQLAIFRIERNLDIRRANLSQSPQRRGFIFGNFAWLRVGSNTPRIWPRERFHG